MLLPERSPRSTALLFLAVLVVIWGGNYTWVKIALLDIGPWTFNAIRYGLAIIIMATVFAALGRGGQLLPKPEERLGLAIVGLLQVAVITTCTALALQWLEASRVVLIAYSMPIWTMPLSALLLNERVRAISAVGAGLGFGGLVLLTNPFAMPWTAESMPGLVLALIAVNGWALGAVLYRRRSWQSTYWQQTFWQLAVSALVLVPLMLFEHDREIRYSLPMLTIALYNSIFPTVIGYWCWAQALTRIPATAASQVLLMSPLFGMVLSHFVLDEPLGAWIWLAATCIVLGAWLSITGATRRKPSTPANQKTA
jgi:drug/metabolite transporter (DMT)-like permease